MLGNVWVVTGRMTCMHVHGVPSINTHTHTHTRARTDTEKEGKTIHYASCCVYVCVRMLAGDQEEL